MLKVLKLKNGEEVLGDVEEAGDELIITKPVRVGLQPKRNGIQPPPGALNDVDSLLEFMDIIFSPWCVLVDDKVRIPASDVLFSERPRQKIANTYNSTLGGGITIPTPQVKSTAKPTLIKG